MSVKRQKKKLKRMPLFLKVVIGMILAVVLTIGSVAGYIYFKLGSITDNTTKGGNSQSIKYKEVKGITNVLLVGTDARSMEETSRSDSMMIITIDNKNKNIKMTSLARDTYVNIPGHGYQKLTHAYAYGGIELLIETLESNFEFDINHYATVNFRSFADAIDALGGVTIDVKEKDVKELNKTIKDSYRFVTNKGDDVELIESPGEQRLNGYQTLAYARIRKHDSAFERDQRQRELMEAMLSELKSVSVSRYAKLLDSVLPYVKTDMKPNVILNLAFTVLSMSNLNINQLEFPLLDYSDGRIRGKDGWVLDFKREINLKVIHDFIFENTQYTDEEIRNMNSTMSQEFNSKSNPEGESTSRKEDKDYSYDNSSYNDNKSESYYKEETSDTEDKEMEDMEDVEDVETPDVPEIETPEPPSVENVPEIGEIENIE